MKITFLGAGSTVFVRNVLGDCMCTPVLQNAEIALYDIDPQGVWKIPGLFSLPSMRMSTRAGQ